MNQINLSDYNIKFPRESIAQYPPEKRGDTRLLIVDRLSGKIKHKKYAEFYKFIEKGDVVVLNDTKVIPARLFADTPKGKTVEVFLLEKHPAITEYEKTEFEVTSAGQKVQVEKSEPAVKRCLIGTAKKLKDEKTLIFNEEIKAQVIDRTKEGVFTIQFDKNIKNLEEKLNELGHTSLPPYIKRPDEAEDKKRYQTIFAKYKGAVAAPTASLNMTKQLLNKLKEKGARIVYVTLHVGYGSFKTIKTDDLSSFKMHSEWFSIPEKTAEAVNEARKSGKNVFAVGTTVTRCLEFISDKNGFIKSGSGEAENFIYPGYKFKCVDHLLTNFHAPQTSVLMMTAAFLANTSVGVQNSEPSQIDIQKGKKLLFEIYNQAVEHNYKFLSYGDSMLIM